MNDLATEHANSVEEMKRLRVNLLRWLRLLKVDDTRSYCDLSVKRADDFHFVVGGEYMTIEDAVEKLAEASESEAELLR